MGREDVPTGKRGRGEAAKGKEREGWRNEDAIEFKQSGRTRADSRIVRGVYPRTCREIESWQNLLSRQLEIDGTLEDNRFTIESLLPPDAHLLYKLHHLLLVRYTIKETREKILINCSQIQNKVDTGQK